MGNFLCEKCGGNLAVVEEVIRVFEMPVMPKTGELEVSSEPESEDSFDSKVLCIECNTEAPAEYEIDFNKSKIIYGQ